MQKKLNTLYFETILPIDGTLERLIRKGATADIEEWKAQHDKSFGDAQNQIDTFLTELAVELKLAAKSSFAIQATSHQ